MMTFNEGDYYRWSYKRHVYDANPIKVQSGTLTWCCSMILKVVQGRLIEIFWGESCGQDTKRWSFEDAKRDMNLRFIANANNLVECQSPDFYDKCLVHDLRHPNNSSKSLIKMLKGAQRSRSVMIAFAEEKALSLNRDIKHAEYSLLRLDEQIVGMESGDDLNKVYV